MKKKIKAIGLFSGGLDSVLATKLMIKHDIDVFPVLFTTVFCSPPKRFKKKKGVRDTDLDITINMVDLGDEYIKMLKKPKFGYGKNLNPCIDCKILMLKKAKGFMRKKKASFVFTGEVMGQRPMSQRKKIMKIIEKEAGLDSLILRPLSAKWLDITIPEQKGWINREKLLELKGRGRRPQIKLAKEFGIEKFLWPAGGCMLTDPEFTRRLQEALDHGEEKIPDFNLLRYGRHFRLTSSSKLIVGRNKEENHTLENLADEKDVLIEIIGCGSPIGLLRNGIKQDIEEAAAICARYSDCSTEKAQAAIWAKIKNERRLITISPFPHEKVRALRI